ncbi:MAG: porphobilinogen synthase [Holosporales bacterium]
MGFPTHIDIGNYPGTRLRRNRQHPWSRRLVAESALSVNDLVLPVFVRDGSHPRDIEPLPGVQRHTISEVIDHVGRAAELGIPAIALFPVVAHDLRTKDAREALNEESTLCQAVREIKRQVPTIGLITDPALDAYTDHGHDGLVIDGTVANDETVDLLVKHAVIQAKAGADMVAPSDMMDGRVGALRQALDASGFQKVSILSYAAKYASAYYGPFRTALGSEHFLGKKDKRDYQMDPANVQEALREVAQDIAEGADLVMVKPGLPYLDVISRVKGTFAVPTLAYHVSGEYAMLKAASLKGWIDYERTLLETLLCFKRAGCDGIFTYAAMDAAILLQKG